jgi:hypothetical protein
MLVPIFVLRSEVCRVLNLSFTAIAEFSITFFDNHEASCKKV